MITSQAIKEYARSLGADDCGIAGVERFGGSPPGFAPADIFPDCKSVIVLLKHMPAGSLLCKEMISYNHAAYEMYKAMDGMAMDMTYFLEEHGSNALIVPCDVPYRYWDPEEKKGMGILSLKHAAVLAGLGMMGKSTLFIHEKYGNMGYLGALLTDLPLEQDDLSTDFACPEACQICKMSCPVGAIGEEGVSQKLCRPHSIVDVGRQWGIYACAECRKKCPLQLGKGKS